MGIQRNSGQPAGITNASGQPEIVLEVGGLVLSMAPPSAAPAATTGDDEDEDEDDHPSS